jgi:hypothetical protein
MSPSNKNKKFDLPVLLSPLEGSAIFTGGDKNKACFNSSYEGPGQNPILSNGVKFQ